MALHYRAEIDGLRAVAVVPVILFHAGYSLFSGGFIGVDVFFVISGYLITSIILKELEAGTFSFSSFYERRARRILPALFLVMICCIPFAWMWMMPLELKAFAVSMASVVVFASNIIFWRQSGYFDTAAELKPLLHTWSLAVEEQFYIVFPIALLLIWRFGRRVTVLSIAVVAAVSFLLCEYASHNHPSFNFYWAITRAWELMAGSLCVFATIRPNRARDDVLSAFGLALIIGSVFWFDNSTRFPSANALLPVGGACLIILFANKATFTARLLSIRPIVGIGLISYSAYLWHQPLFAFARIRAITEPSMWLMAGLALAVFPLAWLTWRYVETPFRSRGKLVTISRQRLVQVSMATAIAVTGFGVAGHLTWGFPNRLSASEAHAHDRVRVNHGLSVQCEGTFTLSDACRTSKNPSVLLWGDSFAMHLAGMLKSSTPPINFVQHTLTSCAPIITATAGLINSDTVRCSEFNKKVFDWLNNSPEIQLVILSSPFSGFAKGTVIDHASQSAIKGSEDVLSSQLIKTIRKINSLGKNVIVVAPPPGAGFDVGGCLRKSVQFGQDPHECEFQATKWTESTRSIYRALEAVRPHADIIWPHHWFCKDDFCNPIQDGIWIYRDAGHLSHEGSQWIGTTEKFRAVRSLIEKRSVTHLNSP